MRIILILIVIAAIFAVIQNQRHGCKWGDPSWEAWFNCIISGTETPAEGTTPAPEPETPGTTSP